MPDTYNSAEALALRQDIRRMTAARKAAVAAGDYRTAFTLAAFIRMDRAALAVVLIWDEARHVHEPARPI